MQCFTRFVNTLSFLGQPGMYILCIYIWGSPRKIFILSPTGFVISPLRNLLLGLTTKNFLKFEIFPGESISPHRGTDARCLDGGLTNFLAKSSVLDVLQDSEYASAILAYITSFSSNQWTFTWPLPRANFQRSIFLKNTGELTARSLKEHVKW